MGVTVATVVALSVSVRTVCVTAGPITNCCGALLPHRSRRYEIDPRDTVVRWTRAEMGEHHYWREYGPCQVCMVKAFQRCRTVRGTDPVRERGKVHSHRPYATESEKQG